MKQTTDLRQDALKNYLKQLIDALDGNGLIVTDEDLIDEGLNECGDFTALQNIVNPTKETASSNDSLQLIAEKVFIDEHFTFVRFIGNMKIITTTDPIDKESDSIAICEAVNNYNALKEINKELVENLERILDRIKENGNEKDFPSAYNRAESALQKAKQNL